MNDSLIIRELDDFALNAEARRMRENVLEASALIGAVNSPQSQEAAVKAQVGLKQMLNLLEKNRKAAKEPLLEAGRKLDAFVNSIAADLETEGMRLAALTGDFQEQQRIKNDAALRLVSQKQTILEKERDEKLANLELSLDESDAIRDEYCERIRALHPGLQTVTAKGQVVADDWDVEIVNLYQLACEHFGCVTCKPNLTEIKRLLSRGAEIAGIKATPKIKSGVRVPPQKKAIQV